MKTILLPVIYKIFALIMAAGFIVGCEVQTDRWEQVKEIPLNIKTSTPDKPLIPTETIMPRANLRPKFTNTPAPSQVPSATATLDQQIQQPQIINLSNAARLSRVTEIQIPEAGDSLTWLAEGKKLGVIADSKLYVYSIPSFSFESIIDLPKRNLMYDISIHNIYDIVFHPDYGDALLINLDEDLYLWNLSEQKMISEYLFDGVQLESAVFDHQRNNVAIAGVRLNDRNRSIEIRTSTGETQLTLSGHKNDAVILEFSPDDKLLAASAIGRDTDQNFILIWDAQTGELLQKISSPYRDGALMKFDSKGDVMAIADDNIILLWDVKMNERIGPGWEYDIGVGNYINSVAFAAQDDLIIANTNSKKILLINVEDGLLLEFPNQPDKVSRVRISPDGRYLAILIDDNLMTIWGVME